MSASASRPGLRTRVAMLSIATLFAWLGCSGDDGSVTGPPSQPPPSTPAVTSVTLSADSVFLGGLGLTRTLSAEARAADGTVVAGAAITWQSSNPTVATVSSGSVAAVAPGSATVTASSGAASATAKVVVQQVPAGLRVSPSSLTLDSLGAVGVYTAVVVDSGGTALPDGAEVEWSSTNGSVAVVTPDGQAEARGPGKAQVVAMDSSGISASAEIEVSVAALAGVVDERGGTVVAPGGLTVLAVPPGAVPYSVALTAVSAQPANTQDVVTGTAVTVGPDITFAVPVDMTVTYDPGSIPGGADERSLGLYRMEGSAWTEVDRISVDTAANTVQGEIGSTGTFAILGNRLGDPTGLWAVTETTVFDSCYDEVGLVERVSVYAEKNGNVLTVEQDGETVSGTLVGDVFGWDERYVVDGVNVREIYSISIARTGLTATGTGRFVGSGPVSCEIRTELAAERVGRDRPQSAPTVASLNISFVEMPGATSRVWLPDVGDGVQLRVTALDENDVTVPNTSFVLQYSEPRVVTDRPEAGRTGEVLTLSPGLVGSTEITAFSLSDDGRLAESAPVRLTIMRDTTLVRILAPRSTGDVYPQGLGRFFDRSPLVVWEDDNAEADRWQVVAGNDTLALRLRRGTTGASACGVRELCADRVSGLWQALGPTGDTPLVRLEGVNALGHVVSRETFHFTTAERNRVDLGYSTSTQIWSIQGNGYSPAGASAVHRYPNTMAEYCTDADLPGCLHAYVQTQWTPKHQVLVVERRPVDVESPLEAARIWIPYKLLDGTVSQSPWNCTLENGTLNFEDAAIVNFQWLANGQILRASGSAGTDPVECSGVITVGTEEFSDIRGTWRIYTVEGEGSMITPEGVRDVDFVVKGAVKWADGQISPPQFWVEGREP